MTEIVDADFRPAPLAVRPEAPASFLDTLRPRDRITMATEIADAIKDVIVQKGWLKRIGQSDHVYVEGWQFVASLAGASCKVVSSDPLADGKGWQARAVVVRIDNGVEIGAGSGMCSRDESTWRTREDYALRAMAETRAMSRALRGVFSFIVELAGYRATPAEEMPDRDDKPLRRDEPAKPKDATQAQHDEIHALAQSLGIPKTRAWIAANVVPGFDKEKRSLNVAEYALVKTALEAQHDRVVTQADSLVDDRKVTPRTNGRLFALLDERLSTEKEARLIFAAEHGVVTDSFSRITEAQARHLIAQLEMLPDPSAALDAYAREKGIV